jgi:hypothetical protein
MATADKELSTAEDKASTLHEVAEKLLRLAERLQGQCEGAELRVVKASWILAGLLLTVVCGFGFWRFWSSGPSEYLWLIALPPLYACAAGGYFLSMRFKTKRRLQNDRRAVHAIVDMLRDIESAIAQQNNLTALERAEFQIRLARFDIGPGLPIWGNKS